MVKEFNMKRQGVKCLFVILCIIPLAACSLMRAGVDKTDRNPSTDVRKRPVNAYYLFAEAHLSLKRGDLDRAAEIATQNAYWNPANIDRDGIRHLLDAAYHGRAPGQ